MSDDKLPQRWDIGPFERYMVPGEGGDYVEAKDVEPLVAEIERLRARVEVLRKELTDIAEYCDELDPTVSTISYAARRALARTAEEAKP